MEWEWEAANCLAEDRLAWNRAGVPNGILTCQLSKHDKLT